MTDVKEKTNPHEPKPVKQPKPDIRLVCSCGMLIDPGRAITKPIGGGTDFGVHAQEKTVKGGCSRCLGKKLDVYIPPPIVNFVMDKAERIAKDATRYQITASQMRLNILGLFANAFTASLHQVRRYAIPVPGGHIDEIITRAETSARRARIQLNPLLVTKEELRAPLPHRLITAWRVIRGMR